MSTDPQTHAPQCKIAIVWGSTTGSTHEVADKLHQTLGQQVSICCNVKDISVEQMLKYDVVLIGASTWNCGEIQYDWPSRLQEMASTDWSAIHFGLFGCGDAFSYESTFADALGIIWETLAPQGARLIGKWPTTGYDFENSKALCDGGQMFLGLPIDNDNAADQTDDRVSRWAKQIKREIEAISKALPVSVPAN